MKLQHTKFEVTEEVRDYLRKCEITPEEIKDVILKDGALADTYIFGGFEKVLTTTKIPTSCVALNQKTNRVSLMMNPRFAKRAFISSMMRKFYGNSKTAKEQHRGLVKLDNLGVVKDDYDLTVEHILKHEFGHVWFSHLWSDCDEHHGMQNIVHDSFINFHLEVGFNLGALSPNPEVTFISSITEIKWLDHVIKYWMDDARIEKDLLKIAQYSKKKLGELNVYDMDMYYRLEEMQKRLNEGVGPATLCKNLVKYFCGIRDCKLTAKELITILRETFKDFKDLEKPPKIHLVCGKHHGGGEPIEIDGETYVPVGDTEIPGLFTMLEDILQKAGVGGEVMQYALGELERATIPKATLDQISKYASRGLLKSTRRLLDLNFKVNKNLYTRNPNTHPVAVDLVQAAGMNAAHPQRYQSKTYEMTRSQEKLHKLTIFTDVSGSMYSHWERVLAFIKELDRLYDITVYQFSDGIHKMTKEDLEEHRIHSSGGTSVKDVVKEIIQSSVDTPSFIVLGDRYYSGPKKIAKAGQALRLLDVGLETEQEPWFKSTDRCKVSEITLDDDFRILTERLHV